MAGILEVAAQLAGILDQQAPTSVYMEISNEEQDGGLQFFEALEEEEHFMEIEEEAFYDALATEQQ